MKPKNGCVIFAKNIAKMSAFYREVLGLPITHEDDSHAVLEDDDVQIVLHGMPKRISDSIVIADPPELREDTSIKPFFAVTNIEDVRKKAKRLGGGVQPKNKEFVARGFRACDGFDPEGNVIQFREDAG